MKTLNQHRVVFGCDPEFFFSKNGKIIGAEKVLPADGLIYGKTSPQLGSIQKEGTNGTVVGDSEAGKIIIDGVQAELNPRPNTCRANLGNEISLCFRQIYKDITRSELGKAFDIDFSQTISVSEEELATLSEKSKKFGCAPSKNTYLSEEESRIKVNPAVYRNRSAGGHLHIGVLDAESSLSNLAIRNPEKLVPILDIILGNTSVLIDRSEGNKERRKIYGRAGEYRTPPHGLEYRTLSNFWLQNYALMSMVTGLSRQAVCIVADGIDKEFRSAVKINKITQAINNNDFDLAYDNFQKIEHLIADLAPSHGFFPLDSSTLDYFKHFVNRGVNYWFKDPPLEHWIKLPEGHGTGFENFLLTVVNKDMVNQKPITP